MFGRVVACTFLHDIFVTLSARIKMKTPSNSFLISSQVCQFSIQDILVMGMLVRVFCENVL